MSTVSDRARNFWDRISPRERRMVVVLGACTPLILAIWLGLNIHDGLVAKEANNDQMRKAIVVLADLKVRGVDSTPGDDVVATMGTEPLRLNTYLDDAAKKAGFTLKGTQTRTPVTRNGFVTTSVGITVSDLTIDELGKFLQEIETASKVVLVTRIDLRRDFKDQEKIDATLEVTTYSREPKKDGESTGSGSASGSGSAEKKS
ncbi:MAG TPA: hypothetical protein VGM90_23325 [Kofleriaceae bacterium]|jgi:type II secretory pathway component PulM